MLAYSIALVVSFASGVAAGVLIMRYAMGLTERMWFGRSENRQVLSSPLDKGYDYSATDGEEAE